MKTYKHAFVSDNWDSIVAEIELVNKAGQMLFGETTDGETIVFDVISVENEDGSGVHDALQTTVMQKNKWIRINTYDPTDHTVCETYKREH